jgi:hypothetical protein
MRAGGVCLAVITGGLLLGCGDDGEVAEADEAAVDDVGEDAEPASDTAPDEASEPDAGDEVDVLAAGDEIEGIYETGPPTDGGEAHGCTWLVTDEQTFTLLHFGGSFDEDMRAEYDGYVLELDGIGRIEEGMHMNAAEQIVAVGGRLRLTVTEVHTIADFGPLRSGCGEADDPLLEFDHVEPVD